MFIGFYNLHNRDKQMERTINSMKPQNLFRIAIVIVFLFAFNSITIACKSKSKEIIEVSPTGSTVDEEMINKDMKGVLAQEKFRMRI